MSGKVSFIFMLTLLTCNLRAQECEHARSRPLVTVYGTSEVKVVPDVVDISIGVEIKARELAPAFSEQKSRVEETVATIRKAGVEPKDIQTDFTSVWPVYSSSKNGRNLDYYVLRKGIAFTLKDTSKYDALMADLVQSGVNRVLSVHFRATEIRKYRDQAREMAITAAREKATALAAKIDQKIGKAFSIEEVDAASLQAPSTSYLAINSGISANSSVGLGGDGGVPTDSSLVVGQISIEARVKVSFDLQ